MTTKIKTAIEQAYPQAVASLIRNVGSIDAGEEAAQEAVLRALKTWPRTGVPDSPAAWLARTGTNFHTDQLRHVQMRRNHQIELVNTQLRRFRATDIDTDDAAKELVFADDLLRLVFTCCHPDLSADAQLALTLKVVLGFSVETIAQSLLVSPKACEKRITRAKRTLAENSDGYRVPAVQELESRLGAVLQTIYLVFTSGFDQSFAGPKTGENLCEVGIRLARMLVGLFGRNSECLSLLALCLLNHARAPARLDSAGDYVPLAEHNRDLWDQALLIEGRALIDAVFAIDPQPGYYQLQAAIASLHNAPSVAMTDWQQISGLYGHLMLIDESPVIALNAAVAQANCGQVDSAQRSLQVLAQEKRLKNYQPLYAALAHVCVQGGDLAGAKAAYTKAITLAQEEPARRWLEKQLAKLG